MIGGIENCDADAIVAGESFFSAEPNITIARLSHCGDGVLRQSAVRGKCGLDILGELFRSFEGDRAESWGQGNGQT